jgi:hypothetical protein
MASYSQILGVLLPKTGPASPAEIAKELGVKVNDVNTPLNRMADKKPPLVSVNEEGNYTITEDGKRELNPITEESEGITEFQQFLNMGKDVGVPIDMARLTANHVWRAGDPNNLDWVLTGLTQQGIRSDLRSRWFHLWRGYLHQPVDEKMQEILKKNRENDVTPGVSPIDSKEATSGSTRLRDYIIDGNNNLLYVGAGNGDYEYADAMKITTLREARLARGANSTVDANGGAKHTQISDATELLEAVQKLSGGNGAKKTVMMVPNEQGGFTMQEIEPGTTITMPAAGNQGAPPAPKSYFFNPKTKQMEEMNPLLPIIIESAPPPPLAPGQKIYIIEDGVMREHDPTKPVVLNPKPPLTAAPQVGMFTIPIGDGKQSGAISLADLQAWQDTLFRIEDHKIKVAHENESHDAKIDIMKTFKDFGVKGVRALGNMQGNEEPEEE